jgi:hypothetical protein
MAFGQQIWANIPGISIIPTVKFPQHVLPNMTAIAKYTIKNGSTLPVTGPYVPANVAIVKSTCPKTVTPGTTCTVELSFTANALGQSAHGGPWLLDGYAKIIPEAGNQIDVTSTRARSDMPQIIVQDPDPMNPIKLLPGTKTILTLKNITNKAANNVQLHLPNKLNANMEAVTSCPEIAAHGICKVSLTPKTSAIVIPKTAVKIAGSNTRANPYVWLVLSDQLFVPGVLKFLAPGTNIDFPITNTSGKTVTITGVTHPSEVTGITYKSNNCSSVAPGATCHLYFDAAQNSYGEWGSTTISYNMLNAQAVPRTQNLKVWVAATRVTINDDQIIRLLRGELHTFNIAVDAGAFSWEKPQVWFDQPTAGVNLVSTTCADVVAPGATCKVQVQVSPSASLGAAGDFAAGGGNLKSKVHDMSVIAGAVTVLPDTTPQNQHISYKAIRVLNDTPSPVTIQSVDLVGLDNKVTVCKHDQADCAYNTDECYGTPSSPLSAAQECVIWLKAIKDNTVPLGKVAGAVKVTINTNTNTTVEKTLHVAYAQDLYAGGLFENAGTLEVNRIARWDGARWFPLGDGVSGTTFNAVNALADYKGDLYAGGEFTVPGNNVAKWNGVGWASLDSGISSDVGIPSVNALKGTNNLLYVGGQFSQAGASPANNIAQWNGTTWSALGLGIEPFRVVEALNTYNGNLYVGGFFAKAGGNDANNIALWNGTNWLPLISGGVNGVSGGEVFTLLAASNELYAGGRFTTAGTLAPVNRIARWDGSIWNNLTLPDIDGQFVYALAHKDGFIYVGGEFDNAGVVPAANIAKWKKSVGWSALGAGISDSSGFPIVLAIAAHMNIYAGGLFNEAGGETANNIAKWNGSEWLPLCSGLDAFVRALLIMPSLAITTS